MLHIYNYKMRIERSETNETKKWSYRLWTIQRCWAICLTKRKSFLIFLLRTAEIIKNEFTGSLQYFCRFARNFISPFWGFFPWAKIEMFDFYKSCRAKILFVGSEWKGSKSRSGGVLKTSLHTPGCRVLKIEKFWTFRHEVPMYDAGSVKEIYCALKTLEYNGTECKWM